MKLERTLKQHTNGVPEVIADGSKAQIIYCIADAKKDIHTLSLLVGQLVSNLEDVKKWVEDEKSWSEGSDLGKWVERDELLDYVIGKARKVLSS